MKKLLLLGAFLLLGFADAQSDKCTNASVSACVENMKQFKLNEYEAIVPTWTEPELNELCSEYSKTDACIDKLINNCTAYDQYYYKAVEESWEYICTSKKQEFLKHRACLATPQLHTDAEKHCTEVWKKRVESLSQDRFRHTSGALNKDGLTGLCNYATDYLQCTYTEVERFCTSDAAAWQRGFDDTLIQPVLRLVGCKRTTENGVTVYRAPDQGLSQTIIIIIAISIALGILVMVIIAILLLRQSKKSRMRDQPHGEPGPYVVYNPDGAMGGPVVIPPTPPSYKEKGDLGPEFGIPMPPAPGAGYGPPGAGYGPPESSYGAPPSYKPAASVYDDGRSVRSGHTTRSGRSSHAPSMAPSGGFM